MRPHVVELSFGHPPTAHILVDKNVFFVLHQRRRTNPRIVPVFAIRRATVRSATDQNWVLLRLIDRGVDRGEQRRAVSHRNSDFRFGVGCHDTFGTGQLLSPPVVGAAY